MNNKKRFVLFSLIPFIIFLGVVYLVYCFLHKTEIMIKEKGGQNEFIGQQFNYSEIGGNSPDYIRIINRRTGKSRVVCESYVICDFTLQNDTLFILAERNSLKLVHNNHLGITIIIDSTCKGKSLYK